MKEVLRSAGHPDLPIVVSGAHSQFVYYFEPDLTRHAQETGESRRAGEEPTPKCERGRHR